jgi:hypothetical protein
MIASVGALFSLNSVVNFLKSSGYKANPETIGNDVGPNTSMPGNLSLDQ